MSIPQLAKNYTTLINQRNTYVSLNNMQAWWFFTTHVEMLARGFTCWFTSDGTTGPTNAGDNTNRLTDATKTATRGATAANAQSYAVYKNADGMQILFAYQGATDDVFRISYSKAAGFVLAGTTTQQPTATDELVVSTGTIIGTGTSLDRVVQIIISTDVRSIAIACYRSAALQSMVGIWHCTSLATVRVTNPINALPYIGFRFTSDANLRRGSAIGTPVGGATNAQGTTGGMSGRFYTNADQTIAVGGGEITLAAAAGAVTTVASTFNSDKPAAQDSATYPTLPIYWSGAKAANTDGFFLTPIDWYQIYVSSVSLPVPTQTLTGFAPADNPNIDTPRAAWLMTFGSAMVLPWNGSAAMVTS